MSNLNDFLKNNDVKVGKDFERTPPGYYFSLSDAFYNYFLTFRDKKEIYHFLFAGGWTREALAINFSVEESHTFNMIIGFHRFIELLLKDILRRINPYLSVKLFENEEQVFEFLNDKLDADSIKTVEFSEALKRFKKAYKYYDKDSKVYIDHLKDYEFLTDRDNLEILETLANWRNRIMHNGKSFPNFLALEYLVSQKIIPLIIEILAAEKKFLNNFKYHFFETKTGIKIIEEIVKIKFHHNEIEENLNPDLVLKLVKIGHLKEMGRAAYNNYGIIRHNHSYYEPYYENPIGRNERFAESERSNNIEVFNLINCPCCGEKTLVVYRKELNKDIVRIMGGGDFFISWAHCYNECGYLLKNNVGDPFQFGLSHEPIFPTK